MRLPLFVDMARITPLLLVGLAACSGSSDTSLGSRDGGSIDAGDVLEDGGDEVDASRDAGAAADGGELLDGELDAADDADLDAAEVDAAEPDAAVDADVDAAVDAEVDAGPLQGCHQGDFTFDDDFGQGLRPQYWSIVHAPVTDPVGGIFSYSDSGGELRFTKVGANTGGLRNIGAVLDLTAAGGPVLGDFSLHVDFRDAVLGATAIDQIELHTVFGDDSIFYNVYSNEGGLGFHVWDGGFRGFVASSAPRGQFRIARVGTTLSAYAVTPGVDGAPNVETLVYAKQQPDTQELTLVRFVAQVFNTNNDVAVTFDDFHIEGSCAAIQQF